MPDKSLFKIICMCSVITGAILGVFPLIPPLIGLTFTILMLFIAPFVIFYLYKLNLIDEPNSQNCLTIGALSGFFSFIGFSFVYFPVALILNLVFKINSFIWIKVIFVNIGFLIPMVILTALLSSMFNSFSAFIFFYLYNYFKPKH